MINTLWYNIISKVQTIMIHTQNYTDSLTEVILSQNYTLLWSKDLFVNSTVVKFRVIIQVLQIFQLVLATRQ